MSTCLQPLDSRGLAEAQRWVTTGHYLHAPVPVIARPEGYAIRVDGIPGRIGCLIVARPQATRCGDWYGSVADVEAGRCDVTRWQVLCLARVWLMPGMQPPLTVFERALVPGFTDRRGVWRSRLPSTALRLLSGRVGFDYLLARPPVFPDEPFELRWLMSYCDTRLHKGTIYREAGWELWRTNEDGIQTWRTPLPALTDDQRERVIEASRFSSRGHRHRAARTYAGAQGVLL